MHGEWCFACGQRQNPIDRFFFSLLGELLEDVLSWDSRAVRTIGALVFKPGVLTLEYLAGRRARYVPPLRLYLITSVTFFFLMSAESFLETDRPVIELYHESADKDVGIANPEEVRKEIKSDIDAVNLSALSPATNAAIRSRIKAQALKAQQDPRAFANSVLNVAPPIMFILVPLFAVFLKLTYLGTGRYFTEHLILSVHNHSFLFVMFILGALFTLAGMLWSPVERLGHDAIGLWIPVYMYVTLLKAYGEGYLRTFAKFSVLTFFYTILFAASVVVAIIMGFMTL